MTFERLRTLYPTFTFDSFSYRLEGRSLHLQFHFQIGEDIRFRPNVTIDTGKNFRFNGNLRDLEGIIFNIGLIELISYWKCTCSPNVLIRPFRLTEAQQDWWRKLYWYGLGEFFFTNRIDTGHRHFLGFTFEEGAPDAGSLRYPHVGESGRVIVPVGGGKDSVVTLEELRQTRETVPFIINPRGATSDCARIAGFAGDDIIRMRREIDPKLIALNAQGYLNGHTPFSAMLAFYSVLASALTGIRDVALSNEASASEPTIPGTYINHQYSKSLEFEEDFRRYVHDFMNDCNHYYSYLRPCSELQIAEKFARYPAYFKAFRSCNKGSKENRWCCNCPKCLFAFIILSPFLTEEQLLGIFGEDLLEKRELEPIFDELTGLARFKPFECVGTVKEVNEALQRIRGTRGHKYLLRHYVDARLQKMEDDFFEDYFNMSMT